MDSKETLKCVGEWKKFHWLFCASWYFVGLPTNCLINLTIPSSLAVNLQNFSFLMNWRWPYFLSSLHFPTLASAMKNEKCSTIKMRFIFFWQRSTLVKSPRVKFNFHLKGIFYQRIQNFNILRYQFILRITLKIQRRVRTFIEAMFRRLISCSATWEFMTVYNRGMKNCCHKFIRTTPSIKTHNLFYQNNFSASPIPLKLIPSIINARKQFVFFSFSAGRQEKPEHTFANMKQRRQSHSTKKCIEIWGQSWW